MPPENDTQFPSSSPSSVSRDGSFAALSPALPVEDTIEAVVSSMDESDMLAENVQDSQRLASNQHDPPTPARPPSLEVSDEALSLRTNESTDLGQAAAENSGILWAPSVPFRSNEHQREQSAEEVLEASLNFDRSNSPAHVLRGTRSVESLYPSLDGLDLEEEEKEEITELASVPMYATASIQESTEEATILATAEDEELLAMKRAAYAGEFSSIPAPAPLHDQEATVVSIAEENVHPSDLSVGAVQAEFIGQDYSSSSEPRSFEPDSYTAVEVESADDTTTEATVIDSAPILFEGEIPLWKVTEEATVLVGADVATPLLDRKPAAVEYTDQEAEEFAVADQEAEIVEIQEDAHPSELSDAAAEAELVGTDDNFNVAALTSPGRHAVAEAIVEEDGVSTYQEDDVIEEVAFIVEEGGVSTYQEDDAIEEIACIGESVPLGTVADQEAEIVEIQEDVHPSELSDAAAEAELVGTDDNFNVASQSPARHAVAEAIVEEDGVSAYQEDDAIEEVVCIGECVPRGIDSDVREVSVTLVEEDYSTASSFPTKTDHPSASASETPPTPRDGVAMHVDTYDDSWIHTALPVAMPPPGPGGAETQGSERSTPGWLQEDAVPSPRTFASEGRVVSNTSDGSHTSLRMLSGIARGTGNVMEALFGERELSVGRRRATTDNAKGSILPRVLLPWTAIFSPTVGMWIATLQTNQKALDSNSVEEASKSLRAFSLPTENQAISLARAWTPPRRHPFSHNPLCHICESKFAIFRRACHCRNCGVCVCKDCVTQWPAKMVPETYNTKKEGSVNVCKTCDWLCTAFRLALLEGDQDKAIALHATGNVNLHTSFGNVKGELLFPVHAATMGKSLVLLQWLVDENCCPIKSMRVSGLGKDSYGKYTAIVTSKNRSLLGIAMENESVDIVRYLVVDKGIALAGEKDVSADMLLRNLDAVLHLLPRISPHVASDSGEADTTALPEPPTAPVADFTDVEPIYPVGFNEMDGARSLSEEARDFGAVYRHGPSGFGGQAGSHNDDECIICFDAQIDCVATPCGHQICCLKCSGHISRCPVCAADCSFMRVFKP